jgi:hypothetical protein
VENPLCRRGWFAPARDPGQSPRAIEHVAKALPCVVKGNRRINGDGRAELRTRSCHDEKFQWNENSMRLRILRGVHRLRRALGQSLCKCCALMCPSLSHRLQTRAKKSKRLDNCIAALPARSGAEPRRSECRSNGSDDVIEAVRRFTEQTYQFPN